MKLFMVIFFFFSSRRRHTRCSRDWSSDVCSSDLLETRIAALQSEENLAKTRDEIAKLEERLARLRQKTYAGLSAWQRTQLARHPKRPHTLDFLKLLLEDFIELHGDRFYGDDAAVVGGLA